MKKNQLGILEIGNAVPEIKKPNRLDRIKTLRGHKNKLN